MPVRQGFARFCVPAKRKPKSKMCWLEFYGRSWFGKTAPWQPIMHLKIGMQLKTMIMSLRAAKY